MSRERNLLACISYHDELFRTFATCVCSKAETCNFGTVNECDCGKWNVRSYTEEAIKHVMLADVGDNDISRKFPSTEDILSRLLFDLISFIESKQMGRHAAENSW